MRLLLVGDNRGDVVLVHEALKELTPPVELRVAEDGHAALDFLSRCAPYTSQPCPDGILLDLNLPRTPGHKVLLALKQDPALRVIPVVVFTSTTDGHEVRRCYELGAAGVIHKPMELEQYLAAVRAVVAFWAVCLLSPLDRAV